MEKKKTSAASVRARLKNRAQETDTEFQTMLIRFGGERLLYRLSQSQYRTRFLLKGATLFAVWTGEPHRPTKDIDLLGFGNFDIPTLENIFREICGIDGGDGLEFKADSIKGGKIRADKIYQGIRITLQAFLAGAKIPLQVDIGFGDKVTPAAETETLETILDLPRPRLKIYPKETVIAEKFEAMVKLGIGNSRIKDFWDVQFLIRNFDFDGALVHRAIRATLATRATVFPPTLPIALTDAFARNAAVAADWQGFIRRGKITADTDFKTVIESLRGFFTPLIEAESQNADFEKQWTFQTGWS